MDKVFKITALNESGQPVFSVFCKAQSLAQEIVDANNDGYVVIVEHIKQEVKNEQKTV